MSLEGEKTDIAFFAKFIADNVNHSAFHHAMILLINNDCQEEIAWHYNQAEMYLLRVQ